MEPQYKKANTPKINSQQSLPGNIGLLVNGLSGGYHPGIPIASDVDKKKNPQKFSLDMKTIKQLYGVDAMGEGYGQGAMPLTQVGYVKDQYGSALPLYELKIPQS